jgi:hypothetical protein
MVFISKYKACKIKWKQPLMRLGVLLIVCLICSSAGYQSKERINDTTAILQVHMSKQVVFTASTKHFVDMSWRSLNINRSATGEGTIRPDRKGFLQSGEQDYDFAVERSTDRFFVTLTNDGIAVPMLIIAAALLVF